MKRSNHTIFRNILLLGATWLFSACDGIFEGIYDTPIQSEMSIEEGSFSQVKAIEYTQWIYINLATRKATTIEIGKMFDAQIPEQWDFAIHRYDMKTNDGAVIKTSYTSMDELKVAGKIPDQAAFVKDEWTTDKVAIDMSGMMDDKVIYTESYRNPVLSDWLNVNTSTMPPVYTLSNQIYLLRLKDDTYAAIHFTNYMNNAGTKGYIDFDYIYPLEFNSNDDTDGHPTEIK